MTESTTVASTIPPPPPYSSLALRIADVLLAAGDMFSGGTIERAVEIAKEWQLAGFKPVAVANWTQIGFWDAQSARLLKDAGFSSHTHVLRFRDGREGDAVYAYCNGDVRLADLEWI